MRRNDRAQNQEFSLELIDRCTHGIMALSTEERAPLYELGTACIFTVPGRGGKLTCCAVSLRCA